MLKRLRTFQTRSGRTLFPSMALALAAGLVLAYCDNTTVGGGTGPDPTGGACIVSALTVAPDNDVIQVDLNQAGATAQKTFTVRSVCTNGDTNDVTSQVTFSLDNQAIGSLNGNTFTSAVQTSTQIAFTRVIATYNNADGQTFTGIANLTVVWLRTTGPATDFFFQLPYLGAAQNQPLQFGTNIQSIDSFFAVDTTSSMTNSIVALRDSLQNTIIPGVKAAAAKDAWFGVGAVEDFPANNNGTPNCTQNPGGPDDQAFILLNGMSSDQAVTSTNVGKLLVGTKTRGCGADIPEGQIEALYQIATGKGNIAAGVSNIPANTSGIGGVGFRKGALPVVTMITDALFHTKGEALTCRQTDTVGNTFTETTDYITGVATASHTRAEMTTALQNICGKVIGVSVQRASVFDGGGNRHTFTNGYCPPTSDLTKLAQATGSSVPPQAWDIPVRPNNCATGMCCTGLGGVGEAPDANGLCPLVFKLADDGSGLGTQITSGITNVARFSSFTVTTQTSGNPTGDNGAPLPTGKTTADFITSIIPATASAPAAPPILPAPVVSGGSFTMVYPGSTVSFTVTTKNDLVPEASTPQVYRANIKVLAGGCTDLDQREVIILVPPRPPTIG